MKCLPLSENRVVKSSSKLDNRERTKVQVEREKMIVVVIARRTVRVLAHCWENTKHSDEENVKRIRARSRIVDRDERDNRAFVIVGVIQIICGLNSSLAATKYKI